MCQKGSEKKRIGRVVFNEEEEKNSRKKGGKPVFHLFPMQCQVYGSFWESFIEFVPR